MNLIRLYFWRLLETPEDETRLEKLLEVMILSLILLNVLIVILSSMQSVEARWGTILGRIERSIVAIFAVEYGLRLWACVEDPRRMGSSLWKWRLRFALTPVMLVDLGAVLPALCLPVLGGDALVLRMVRLIRMFSLFRLGRFTGAQEKLLAALKESRETLLLSAFFGAVWLVTSATILYACEARAQPDKFGDIPSALWWAVISFTTIGYGDVFPVTPVGKACATVFVLTGIAILAVPISALTSAFNQASARQEEPLEARQAECLYCPHCGSRLDHRTDAPVR